MSTRTYRQGDGGSAERTGDGRGPGRRALLAGVTGMGALAGSLALGGSSASAATAGGDPYVVDVVAKGADPTGQTASDAAFRAAAAELLGSFQPGPISGAIPKKTLLIPPGTYLLTQPDSLLPGEDGIGHGGIVDGIAIRGYGKRLSRITYAPTARDTTLWTNRQRYKNIRISGLTFESKDATATFNYAYSSDAAGVQDTWYEDVEWRGSWKVGIGLDGPAGTSDLNSEMGWDHCQIGGSYTDAFLVIGMTPAESQQDQFLNYWFRDCKVEYKSGSFVRNERGGSMNFTGGSYILTDAASTGTFFQLGSAAGSRADSVMRLYAQGIRFELRGPGHKVIDSSWYKGNITFVSCDDTALSFQSWAPNAVTHVYRFDAVNPSRGPMVRYQDCALMGSHQVSAATATTAGKLLYDGCRFIDMTAGTGTTGFLRWTGTAPWYEFRDCQLQGARLADVKAP
ncbi:hypothetical protein [Kitasatospora sp. MBT63]|uniref:hypothetical protein n=1 Tax=Kitasatospora sp. MBT63 TaxID=1444768 RepID=UPI001E5687D4|nr:hypothetical protein [Kitasatospora sp. MBT63]